MLVICYCAVAVPALWTAASNVVISKSLALMISQATKTHVHLEDTFYVMYNLGYIT